MDTVKGFAPVDFNRGVTIRVEPDTGISVYMYKDDPGTYLARNGKPVPKGLALRAGFPIEELEQKRLKLYRKRLAVEMIDREMATQDEGGKILAERNGFKVVDRGYDRADLMDADGMVYNPRPVPVEVAMKLLDTMAGDEPVNQKALLEAKQAAERAERLAAQKIADATKADKAQAQDEQKAQTIAPPREAPKVRPLA